MKILLVNTSDIGGGAARAVYRLHKALLAEGVDSLMLVQEKKSDDYTVIGPETKVEKVMAKIRPIMDSIPVKFYKNRIKTPFSPAWVPFSNIVKKINEIKPNIVHLNWICGGLMRIEDIAKIKSPIVWSLHDNWAFTGGCHIMWDCEKYRNECGACPILGSNKNNDLSKKIFYRKQKTFGKINNMVIVGLSKWLSKRAEESTLLKDKKHINLPNPIDTKVFKPFDKIECRRLWNFPKDKKIILFSAIDAIKDINKGFGKLIDALYKIKCKDIELVVAGSGKPLNTPNFKFKVHYIGRLYDDISLVTLYNASDVVVVPSLQETLSNTVMESLSCGTPVVVFDVGGNSDMIEHKINGYLAKPFDTTDLANGIEWVLNNPNYDELCKSAREKVVREFDSRVVAKKYIKLYEEILKNS